MYIKGHSCPQRDMETKPPSLPANISALKQKKYVLVMIASTICYALLLHCFFNAFFS